MARMHSKKHGRASSHKPTRKIAPNWIKTSKEEVYKLVEKLAREGSAEAKIGLVLRDQYGIPSVKLITKKTVSEILKEKGIAPQYPSDLLDLIRRAARMRKHLGTHKQDDSNISKLKHVESKVFRLSSYYKREGKLPSTWRYSPEAAALLVK
ncbi:MAG TPA: 30S ribosomal protein S15 [Candidatus Norongarragalinales archaeon]|jgi:small subunit ribosomal protein S15|nr:30S ribosomal protein S15 [Candidatus Norongarragalinales archaeon]